MQLGSDPEYPVYKDGQLTMAIGQVGGSKTHPLPMSTGFVQEDGVMVEINPPPASSEDEFVTNTLATYNALQEHLTGKGLSCLAQSCVHFTREELMAAPSAMKFGCLPERDGYTGHNIKMPSPYTTLRVAGGHIHIDHPVALHMPHTVIQACDLYLGLPSLLVDKAGNERRELYGKPGSFRHKPYGVEYRVLSNFWTTNEAQIRWVWQAVGNAIQHVSDMRYIPTTIAHVIAQGDATAAATLMERHSIPVCPEQGASA